MPAPPSRKPQIEGYEILSPLGQGGMATVWLARQVSFDRKVAIKLMNESLVQSDDFVARFLQEAKTVAKLGHPGIITVYDMGESDDGLYLAMELLPGPDLKERLAKGEVSSEEAPEIVARIADALDHAHKKNVIHRDIKPANILFRDDGSPVLVDFGIARNLEATSQLTIAGTIMGTPAYMSPEQCRGDPPTDYRTDIYSLGVLLYLLLEKRLPFVGDNHAALALQHTTAPVPRASPANKHLQRTIERALEKNREKRFQSAGDFADAIRAACRPGAAEPRNWTKSAAATIAGFIALLGLAGALALLVTDEASVVEQSAAQETTEHSNVPAPSDGETDDLPNSEEPGDSPVSAASTADLEESLVRAKVMLWNGDMFEPPGRNALELVGEILEQAPGNQEAQELRLRLLTTLETQVEASIAAGDTEQAAADIARLERAGASETAAALERRLSSGAG